MRSATSSALIGGQVVHEDFEGHEGEAGGGAVGFVVDRGGAVVGPAAIGALMLEEERGDLRVPFTPVFAAGLEVRLGGVIGEVPEAEAVGAHAVFANKAQPE